MKLKRFSSTLLISVLSYCVISAQFNERLNPTVLKNSFSTANRNKNLLLLANINREESNTGNFLYQKRPVVIQSEITSIPEETNYYSKSYLLKKSGFDLSAVARENMADITVNQNSGYTRSKLRYTDYIETTVGLAFAAAGTAILLATKVPDFSEDAKEGPQLLFVSAITCIPIGLGLAIADLLHKTPVLIPEESADTDMGNKIITDPDVKNNFLIPVKQMLESGQYKIREKVKNIKGTPSQVGVYDDHFEIITGNDKYILTYEEIYKYGVTKFEDYGNVIAVNKLQFINKKGYSALELENKFTSIRLHIEKLNEDQKIEASLESFKPVAARYRSLIEKPEMSEVQRKMIVESDMYTSQGKFQEAINSLHAALEMDPFTYPQGFSNLAYLYERTGYYPGSIMYMKMYLLLEPFAEDARKSQDKIYEWELKRKNNQ